MSGQSLLVLLRPDAVPRCPACGRRLGGDVRVLPGSRGGLVIPLRCPRKSCRAALELVLHLGAQVRAAIHVAGTATG